MTTRQQTVAILMATLDGAQFLSEQLTSIAEQDHTRWRLWVSDDGSRDKTIHILKAFARNYPPGKVTLLDGPQRGAVANFRSLLRRVDLKGMAVAFCDQDDRWLPGHLSRGLTFLVNAGNPLAVAGSRMVVCDSTMTPVGLSPLPTRALGFRNALLQNVLSGNTMMVNAAAARLLQEAEAEAGPFPVHDWWAYQLITGAGGTALFDAEPQVMYRQHPANSIGANRGLRALPARVRRHFRGDYALWAQQNATALAASSHRLTNENRRILELFHSALGAPLRIRIRALRAAGLYHQSARARAAFWLSAILGTF